MIDRKQIKAAAKARMAQAVPSCWQVMLVWVLAAAVVPQLVLSLASGDAPNALQNLAVLLDSGVDPDLALQALKLSAGQISAAWVLSLVLNIFLMVLGFGLTVYCLRLYRGQDCGTSNLFAGFSMAGRVIGQQVLVYLIAMAVVILLTIPLVIVSVLAYSLGDAPGVILVFAAVIGMTVLVVAIMLNYALAALALADQPDLGALGSIQYGKNLIRGHKGEYVLFVLSFFGWALLCSLLSGIFTGICTALRLPIPLWAADLVGVALMLPYYLWLMPYMQTSLAGFYDALRQEKDSLPPMPPL